VPRLTENRQKFVKQLTPEEVVDMDSWVDYAHQKLGIAFPTAKTKPALNKIAKEFFEEHPEATWRCLVDVVRWAKHTRKSRHFSIQELLGSWRYAHEQGFMTMLSRIGMNDEETLKEMLKSVDSPYFSDRMKMARTAEDRDEVMREYEASLIDKADKLSTYEDTPVQFADCRLRMGMMVRYRLTLAEEPRVGTLLREEDGGEYRIYTGDREIRLPSRLLSFKIDGAWETL
jgi:hypothetical protein